MSLEFVETAKLLKELQKRLDTMVFLGAVNRTADDDNLLFAYAGSFHGCLGLIEVGRLMVLAREGDDDDADHAH
ncbi:MAG: hypothetical protein Unbinned7358contig1001_30 [Prokaryotic dsDNA virus sp.]|nr:MAG: hypothetical protein Unbinned7358contig1001_30 [Prokaryotic dsDNA virus sp.]